MQILVKVPFGEKPGEWTIVELQGELESRELASLSGKFIGDLHYSKQGVPILIIGHHILHGKVVKLDKPMAIIEKVPVDKNDSKDTKRTSSTYIVKAIVSKKLLFKTRPKPIIANVFAEPN